MSEQPFCRARVYVNGRLVADDDISVAAMMGDAPRKHARITRAAESEGLPYLVELEFADGDHVRWGTDANGMVEPIPTDDLYEAIIRRLEAQ